MKRSKYILQALAFCLTALFITLSNTNTLAQPANDLCINAIPLTVDATETCVASPVDNTAATDSGEAAPTCASYAGGDVWYSVTVPASGIVSVETNNDGSGTITDSGMSLYSGACGALTQIECDDDDSPDGAFSLIELTGQTPGDIIYVRVWEFSNDAVGTFSVCAYEPLPPPPPPANDMCADAIALPVNADLACGMVINATIESATDSGLDTPPEDNTICGGTEDDDIWFTFVATNTDHIINLTNVTGSTTDLYHSVWSGSCGALTNIVCSDPNTSTITGLVPGTTYYVRIYTWTATAGQDSVFDVCIGTQPPPPPNDECATATPYPEDVAAGTCVTGFDFSAYTDSGNPSPTCDFGGDAVAWFSWTAPITTVAGDPIDLTFDDGDGQATDCNLGIEAYETDCLTTASNCLSNVSGNLTGLVQGTDYVLLIYQDSPSTASCDFCLTIACSTPTATATAICQPGDESGFYVEVNVTNIGTGNSAYTVDVAGPQANITATGITTYGPFPSGTPVDVVLTGVDDALCGATITGLDKACVCDPLSVEAVADGIVCPGDPFTLEATLNEVIPEEFIDYTVTTAAAGSCTAVADNPADCVDLALGDDAGSGPLPLGFSFDFFGVTYTDVCVGSNGYVTFACVDETNLSEDPIPDPIAPNAIVALFWDDLNPTDAISGIICTYLATIGGQTCFVADYQNIAHFGGGETVTGQIIICPDNTVTINCIDCQSDGGTDTAVQGIEDENGATGNFDPAFPDGTVPAAATTSNCVTFTPNVDPPSACDFVAWVTDVNDIAGTTVSTTNPANVNPTITTTYFAVVDCNGVPCIDDVIVTMDDPANCATCTFDSDYQVPINECSGEGAEFFPGGSCGLTQEESSTIPGNDAYDVFPVVYIDPATGAPGEAPATFTPADIVDPDVMTFDLGGGATSVGQAFGFTLGTVCNSNFVSMPIINNTCEPLTVTFFALIADNDNGGAFCPDPERHTVTFYPTLTAVDVTADAATCGTLTVELQNADGMACDTQTQACTNNDETFNADFTGGPFDYGVSQSCNSIYVATTEACAMCGPVCQGIDIGAGLPDIPTEVCSGAMADICLTLVDASEGLTVTGTIDGASVALIGVASGNPNELCVTINAPVNETCDVIDVVILIEAITCADGTDYPGILGGATLVEDLTGADFNPINVPVYPTLTVNTMGDGTCGMLNAELVAIDGTICATAADAPFTCAMDGDTFDFDFTGDMALTNFTAPPADCPLPTLMGTLTCANCNAPCDGLAANPNIVSPVELCDGDGPIDLCFTLVDATQGINFDINIDGASAGVIAGVAGANTNELCIQLPMVANQTCSLNSFNITFNAITCDNGDPIAGPASPSLADDLNADGGITINVYPNLIVNTAGDGTCGMLSAELIAADNTICAAAAGSPLMCAADGEVLTYDFTGDVTFTPPAACPLPTLSGMLTCGGCSDPCNAAMSTISTTDPTRICIDGVADPIDVTIDTDGGGTGAWVITDAAGIILGLPAAPPFDLDGAGVGQCSIWYFNSDDAMFNPMLGDDALALVAASSCAFLSNPITVDRVEVVASTISSPQGNPITICTDDGIDEPIEVTIDDSGTGANGAWVITDAAGIILGLPMAPPFLLDAAGVGQCSIWWVNFDDPNFTPAVGDDALAIVAAATCAVLSNPITVIREENCGVCEDAIVGNVNVEEPMCDITGMMVEILDSNGMPVAGSPVAVDAATGDYSLPGPFPCGAYTVQVVAGTAPICYAQLGGTEGPFAFEINGDGTADGANFGTTPQIPTLSQWGLITLALLMMCFGAVKMANSRRRKFSM